MLAGNSALHLPSTLKITTPSPCIASPGGGCELIEYYAEKAGAKPFTSYMLQDWPDLDLKNLRRIQRQYWNAFKHATHLHSGKERDNDELLGQFTDVQNDTALFIGWYDYAAAMNTMPVEAQVHQSWDIALRLDKLAPNHSPEAYKRVFPELLNKPRS